MFSLSPRSLALFLSLALFFSICSLDACVSFVILLFFFLSQMLWFHSMFHLSTIYFLFAHSISCIHSSFVRLFYFLFFFDFQTHCIFFFFIQTLCSLTLHTNPFQWNIRGNYDDFSPTTTIFLKNQTTTKKILWNLSLNCESARARLTKYCVHYTISLAFYDFVSIVENIVTLRMIWLDWFWCCVFIKLDFVRHRCRCRF